MATGPEMKEMFWDALEDSPVVMLGLAGVDDAHTQPMTAQFDEDLPNRIYFYTKKDNRLVKGMSATHAAVLNFAAKGHDLFACIHGTLTVDNDPQVIDKFWMPTVAAWYEKGKEDPNLAMLRFDCGNAEIWTASAGDYLHWMTASIFRGSADAAAQDDVAKVQF